MIGIQETFEALSHFLFLKRKRDIMKEYKTINELIEKLHYKGIAINDVKIAKQNIQKYSYYTIVNSYKSVFKNKDNEYKQNVTFEEIYSLFEFDKNIRSIFLKYILDIELIIKSHVAELLSSQYGIKNFLNKNNFDTKIGSNIINENIKKIQEEINKQYQKHNAITHYIDEYNFVPPFVLVKILTLGEISKIYFMLKQRDRQIISKEFKISDKVLKQIIKNITIVRNICAHNERLFTFRSKFFITFKEIEKNYNTKYDNVNLYMIMKSMQKILDNKQSTEFEKEINNEINRLNTNIKSINTNIILQIMGYNTNK